MSAASKVTLTLPTPLLEVVDQYVAAHPGTTSSDVCARALHEWLRAMQEDQIEHYYRTLSSEEQDEDSAWVTLAARSATRLWP